MAFGDVGVFRAFRENGWRTGFFTLSFSSSARVKREIRWGVVKTQRSECQVPDRAGDQWMILAPSPKVEVW